MLQRGDVVSYPGDRRDTGVFVGGECLWLGPAEPDSPSPYPDAMDDDGMTDDGPVRREGMVLSERHVAALERRTEAAVGTLR